MHQDSHVRTPTTSLPAAQRKVVDAITHTHQVLFPHEQVLRQAQGTGPRQ